jgi:gliding motility-associated-like protein
MAAVPWIIDSSVIYRKLPGHHTYDSLTTTTAQSFTDAGLINDSSYCYYVKTIGGYTATGLKSPLINLSQRVCTIPVDTVGPCAPDLVIHNICTTPALTNFQNILSWRNVNRQCPFSAGAYYNLYYKRYPSGVFSLLATLNGPNDTTYVHSTDSGLAGCYAIQAIDSIGNKGKLSAAVCVDNCPEYVLPNAFTPDNDGHNDYFHPRGSYAFINHVDMHIYNRWGKDVFATRDPEIHWDGKDMDSGNPVPDGVYYYTCVVYSNTLKGVSKLTTLKGYIQLVRH